MQDAYDFLWIKNLKSVHTEKLATKEISLLLWVTNERK